MENVCASFADVARTSERVGPVGRVLRRKAFVGFDPVLNDFSLVCDRYPDN